MLVVTSGFGAAPPPAVPDDVRVVDGGEARNLSVARNAGIRAARGELVLFIDDDAIPEPNWARALAEGLADPEVAAAGGPHLDPSGARLQVRYSLANALGAARACRRPEPERPPRLAVQRLRAVYTIGTNSGFRREALVAIGGFDEEYEYYLDETDVCRRLLARGWLVRALDAGYVAHGFLPNELRGESRAIARRYSVFKNRAYLRVTTGATTTAPLQSPPTSPRSPTSTATTARSTSPRATCPPETAQVLEEEVVAGYDDGFAAFVRGPRTRPPAWFSATPEPLVQLRTLRAAQPLPRRVHRPGVAAAAHVRDRARRADARREPRRARPRRARADADGRPAGGRLRGPRLGAPRAARGAVGRGAPPRRRAGARLRRGARRRGGAPADRPRPGAELGRAQGWRRSRRGAGASSWLYTPVSRR